jgi:hypothetical protein
VIAHDKAFCSQGGDTSPLGVPQCHSVRPVGPDGLEQQIPRLIRFVGFQSPLFEYFHGQIARVGRGINTSDESTEAGIIIEGPQRDTNINEFLDLSRTSLRSVMAKNQRGNPGKEMSVSASYPMGVESHQSPMWLEKRLNLAIVSVSSFGPEDNVCFNQCRG